MLGVSVTRNALAEISFSPTVSGVTFGESILAFERYPIPIQFLSVGGRVVQDISGRKWEIHQSPDCRPILELDARDEVIPKREGDRGRHWPSQFKRQCSLSLLPSSLDPVMPTEITPPARLPTVPTLLPLVRAMRVSFPLMTHLSPATSTRSDPRSKHCAPLRANNFPSV